MTLTVKGLRADVSGKGVRIPSAAELLAAAESYRAALHADGWGDPRIAYRVLAIHYTLALTLLGSDVPVVRAGAVPGGSSGLKPNLRDVMGQADRWVDVHLDTLVGPGAAASNVNMMFTAARQGGRPSPAVVFGTAGRVGWVTVPEGDKRTRRFYRMA